MNRRILVVGASGFIGTRLVRALHSAEFSIVAVSAHPGATFPADVEHIAYPLDTAREYSPILAGCRSVVWLASTSTPGSSAGNPLKELEENLRPFFVFLNGLQQQPQCELLYISTGGAIYGDVPGGLAAEDLRLAPKSYYSAGKAAVEHFISACCHQYGCRATILRPSNVYGRGQPYREGFGIIPAAFDALAHDHVFTIWGNGETIRDYLNIDDFISLCVKVLSRGMPAGANTFNAASGQGLTVNELLSAIERVTGKALRRNYLPLRSVDVSRVVLDDRKTREAFDWQPSVGIEDGLAKAWQWFNSTTP